MQVLPKASYCESLARGAKRNPSVDGLFILNIISVLILLFIIIDNIIIYFIGENYTYEIN